MTYDYTGLSSFSSAGSALKNLYYAFHKPSGVDAVSGAAPVLTDRDYFAGDVVNKVQKAKDIAANITSKAEDLLSNGSTSSPSSYVSSSASATAPATPQRLSYVDAPYAEMYGMDASTAYNEALANTAYQRKVADLKAAGLNPVLGISGAGADNFYGVPAAMSSGSSGGVSYGSGSSGKSSLSQQATKLGYWVPTLVNGLTNLAVTLKTGNSMSGYGAGMVAQNLASGLLSGIRNHG